MLGGLFGPTGVGILGVGLGFQLRHYRLVHLGNEGGVLVQVEPVARGVVSQPHDGPAVAEFRDGGSQLAFEAADDEAVFVGEVRFRAISPRRFDERRYLRPHEEEEEMCQISTSVRCQTIKIPVNFLSDIYLCARC